MTSNIKVVLEGDNRQAIVALANDLLGTTVTAPPATQPGTTTPPPVVVPPPPSVNLYKPFTMADALPQPVVDGIYPTTKPSELNFGTGAHSLSFNVGMGAGSLTYLNSPLIPVVFDLWITDALGRHRIAQHIVTTGWGWSGQATNTQRVTFNWDYVITQAEMVPGSWPDYTVFRDVALDGKPMYNGTATYAAGGAGSANRPATFQLTPQAAPASGQGAGTTVPAGTPQLFNGKTLAELLAAGPLPAGEIVDVSACPGDASGAGMGVTILNGTGLALSQGKSILRMTKHGKISDMTIKGAAGPQNNGAGVREDAAGIGFDLLRVEVCLNQDGVLTFGGADHTFDSCNFHNNGAGDGQSHNIYIGWGSPADKFSLLNSSSVDPKVGHAVKSRAGTTTGLNNLLRATDGACYDIPDGGFVNITGDHWIKPAGSADHKLMSYAAESSKNGIQPINLTDILADCPDGNALIVIGQPTTVNLTNCRYTGPKAPAVQWKNGVGTVVGAWTPAP